MLCFIVVFFFSFIPLTRFFSVSTLHPTVHQNIHSTFHIPHSVFCIYLFWFFSSFLVFRFLIFIFSLFVDYKRSRRDRHQPYLTLVLIGLISCHQPRRRQSTSSVLDILPNNLLARSANQINQSTNQIVIDMHCPSHDTKNPIPPLIYPSFINTLFIIIELTL